MDANTLVTASPAQSVAQCMVQCVGAAARSISTRYDPVTTVSREGKWTFKPFKLSTPEVGKLVRKTVTGG